MEDMITEKYNKLKGVSEGINYINNIKYDKYGRGYDISTMAKGTQLNDIIKLKKSTEIVYRFDRGVIGITETGDVYEEILDGTNNFHGETTKKIGKRVGCIIPEEIGNSPFLNGVIISLQGVIIIQLEGSAMFVYLPKLISAEQYQNLILEVIPRKNFKNIMFHYDNQIHDNDDINADTLLAFSKTIIKNKKVTGVRKNHNK